MALRSGTPGLELALTLLAVLAFQRFFAAYGAGIWIALYDSAGPQWAAMALVYVAAFNLVWQFCRFGSARLFNCLSVPDCPPPLAPRECRRLPPHLLHRDEILECI